MRLQGGAVASVLVLDADDLSVAELLLELGRRLADRVPDELGQLEVAP